MDTATILPFLAALAHLRAHDSWTPAHLAAHQARALVALRRHAMARSPFYARFHRGLESRPLAELPVLTKETVMAELDDLVTDRRLRLRDLRAALAGEPEVVTGGYRLAATSGSTGAPGIFVYSSREWATLLAGFARTYVWAGHSVGVTSHQGVAVVGSMDRHHLSYQVGQGLRGPWVTTLALSVLDPLAQTVERLNAFQPDELVAFATLARLLASEQAAGRLRIHPQAIFTVAELLTADARQAIEAVWPGRLFDHYATTETGALAAECSGHHGLHLNEDQVLIEVVDDHDRPVPPGEYGTRLLATVLYQRTMPLIRYAISDSVAVSPDPCPCGRPYRLLLGVQGRQEEVLWMAGAGGPVAVVPNFFHRLMDAVAVQGWQARLHDGGLDVVLAGAAPGFDDGALVQRARAGLESLGVTPLPVFVRHVAAIRRVAGGKFPLVKDDRTGRAEAVDPGVVRERGA